MDLVVWVGGHEADPMLLARKPAGLRSPWLANCCVLQAHGMNGFSGIQSDDWGTCQTNTWIGAETATKMRLVLAIQDADSRAHSWCQVAQRKTATNDCQVSWVLATSDPRCSKDIASRAFATRRRGPWLLHCCTPACCVC